MKIRYRPLHFDLLFYQVLEFLNNTILELSFFICLCFFNFSSTWAPLLIWIWWLWLGNCEKFTNLKWRQIYACCHTFEFSFTIECDVYGIYSLSKSFFEMLTLYLVDVLPFSQRHVINGQNLIYHLFPSFTLFVTIIHKHAHF